MPVRKSRSMLVMALLFGVLVLAGCRQIDVKPQPTPTEYLPLASPLGNGTLDSPVTALQSESWPTGRIAFHSDKTGIYQIYWVDNGRGPEMISGLAGVANEPTWSPDGTQLAFAMMESGANTMEIFTINVDGSGLHRVMSDQPRLNWRPAWSPDGKSLLFQSNRDGNFEIYRVTTNGEELTNLTNDPSNDGDADWSPDGGQIVFVSDRGRSG